MRITNKAMVMLGTLILICGALSIFHVISRIRIKRLKEFDSIEEKYLFREELEDTEFLVNKLKEIARSKHRIKHLKSTITGINERQHIGRAKNQLNSTAILKALAKFQNMTNLTLKTVIVIQVHGNYRFVRVLLESLQRIVGISESLLIFAHDYYDVNVYKVISEVHFARVMQVFYPYSVQLHPYRYPGEDLKFCEDLNKCIESNERDPIQSQAKLFWWWMVNQVFDHIEVLKNYNDFIYFLETEAYLTSDFILMVKILEHRRPGSCTECRILSLAARPPRPELYRRENSSLVIGVWGWSKTKYIDYGIGFNRSTWNEIKSLKKEFCYFDDFSWENSLKHLASKTHQKLFFMLSTEGPRIFPTNDCTALGNGTHCDVGSTLKDIVNFIRTTSHGLFPYKFQLEFDSMDGVKEVGVVQEQGGWDDARDRELCMFIASNGRRVYY